MFTHELESAHGL